jgi:putative hydrolase of the HAD superfamily
MGCYHPLATITAKNMQKISPIKTLFLDIGGVLLTNGWDHDIRKLAATHFQLDNTEMESRHHLSFDTFEEGKLTLDEYLNRIVFYEPRPFSVDEFREFMFVQSQPHNDMIELIQKLKVSYGLKIAVLSNEGRELNAYRINTFKLDNFVDLFISSCYVHLRKPDLDIFKLALDIAQTPAEQSVFIDNTELFTKIAQELGMHSIVHTNYQSTMEQLALLGLHQDISK